MRWQEQQRCMVCLGLVSMLTLSSGSYPAAGPMAAPTRPYSKYRPKYMPSDPGDTPTCLKDPRLTYCIDPDDYPKERIRYLLENKMFDVSTILMDETRDTYTYETMDRYQAPMYGYPKPKPSNGYLPPVQAPPSMYGNFSSSYSSPPTSANSYYGPPPQPSAARSKYGAPSSDSAASFSRIPSGHLSDNAHFGVSHFALPSTAAPSNNKSFSSYSSYLPPMIAHSSLPVGPSKVSATKSSHFPPLSSHDAQFGRSLPRSHRSPSDEDLYNHPQQIDYPQHNLQQQKQRNYHSQHLKEIKHSQHQQNKRKQEKQHSQRQQINKHHSQQQPYNYNNQNNYYSPSSYDEEEFFVTQFPNYPQASASSVHPSRYEGDPRLPSHRTHSWWMKVSTSPRRRYKRQVFGEDVGAMELCPSRATYIAPRAAQSIQGDWMYLVNLDDNPAYTQLVRSETCIRNRCSGSCQAPPGSVAVCQQQFVQKRLIALNNNGDRLNQDIFWFPSCCQCKIRRQ